MPGFFISTLNGNSEPLDNFYNNNKSIKECIENKSYSIKRNTLNKFLDDKIFSEDNRYIVIIEGVVLNKVELINKYGKRNFFDTIVHQIDRGIDDFFKEFKGSFSGAVYKKGINEWIIFTNHIGDNQVFYYSDKGNFIIGNEVNYIVDTLNNHNIKYRLDEQAVYATLTFSFQIDNKTYIKEIEKLENGCYLKISKGKLVKIPYYQLTNDKYDLKNLNEDELIEQIDMKFRKAITLEYNKDLEYGYTHFAELSGGLDSRMNVWVASDLGYKNILALSYSKSGYFDARIAEQVSTDLNINWIFKSLDSPEMIYDIEEIVKMNFGLDGYFNVTKSNTSYKHLNINNIGLCHTGQLGGAILGSYLKNNNGNTFNKFKYGYSNKLANQLKFDKSVQYENEEMFAMNVRGFRGILNSHSVRRNYFETVSPFLDIDMLEFCLSIPIELRKNRTIYKKWILKKYPKAAEYKWEKTGAKMSLNSYTELMHKIRRRGWQKLSSLIGLETKAKADSMNPYQYWYENSIQIRDFMDEYFNQFSNHPKISAELKNDINKLYHNGTALEKSQVLTALATIKIYF
ncbi:hypothetical protein [Fredinandcohnia sp. 179-A 10B2 NHS]|uniref:hypothetical protein n=1 Tax=Fredinandcohnia sp. 179-A 10B2 NHS TaxID=3235176 RepID=UPI00399F9CD2